MLNIPPALATVIVVLTAAIVAALLGMLVGALIHMRRTNRYHQHTKHPGGWSVWMKWLSVFVIIAVFLLYFAMMKVYDVSQTNQPVFHPSILRVDV